MQNGNQKKTRVVILLSYKKKKTPLKYRLLEKTQKRTPHNDKRINPGMFITIVNIYVPNTGAPQYIRQILTQY